MAPRTQSAPARYRELLQDGFRHYRESRFSGQDHLFEARPEWGAVVFERSNADHNVLVPPMADDHQRRHIVRLVPFSERHRHFGSLQSSQALAQSVFAALVVLDRLPFLAAVVAEDGRPAFGPAAARAQVELEKRITKLGEPRPTSVDVWLEADDQVAVECKLGETDFGSCSRPGLPEHDPRHCNGRYSRQRGRAERCSLTTAGVRYWDYLPDLFGWSATRDHDPCPLRATYQLARNVLAACTDDQGHLDEQRGHALVLYDRRNPAMMPEGEGERQWQAVAHALRRAASLRRLSWQAFLAQWPSDPVLDWLKEELAAKYGLVPAGQAEG